MDAVIKISLCALVVAMVTTGPVTACSCALEHPQTTFCQDDFALKVRVLESQIYDQDSDMDSTDSNATVRTDPAVANQRRYTVHLMKVFKPSPAHNMTENATFEHIYTPVQDATCGVNLEVGSRYLITGYVTESGEAHSNLCHGAVLWDTLSSQQRKAYSYKYTKGCDCEVKPCFQPKCHKKADDNQCMWNFRADKGMCYMQHAICRRSEGKCAWRTPSDFDMCMERYSR